MRFIESFFPTAKPGGNLAFVRVASLILLLYNILRLPALFYCAGTLFLGNLSKWQIWLLPARTLLMLDILEIGLLNFLSSLLSVLFPIFCNFIRLHCVLLAGKGKIKSTLFNFDSAALMLSFMLSISKVILLSLLKLLLVLAALITFLTSLGSSFALWNARVFTIRVLSEHF